MSKKTLARNGAALAAKMRDDIRTAETEGLTSDEIADGKISLTADQVAAKTESLGKCINPDTGEPLSARREEDAVRPVTDSRTESADGNGRGTCPFCGAHVALSGKGYLTAHPVRKNPIPAPSKAVRLAEPQTPVTDTGARVGSPDAAERTRTAELAGSVLANWHPPLIWPEDQYIPTVTIKVRETVTDSSGKPVMRNDGKTPRVHTVAVEMPATEENVRTAIRQEQRRKQYPETVKDPVTGKRTPTGRTKGGPDQGRLAKLSSMLKGFTRQTAVPVLGAEPGTYRVREAAVMDAHNAPEGREERARTPQVRLTPGGLLSDNGRAHIPTAPGTALVTGRTQATIAGDVTVRTVRDPYERPPMPTIRRTTPKGKPRNAISWSEPVGSTRPDRVVITGGDASACRGKGCTIEGCVAIVGGRYGDATCAEYRTWGASKRRTYWTRVAGAKKYARKAAELAKRPRTVSRHPQHITGATVGTSTGTLRRA